MRSLQRDWRIMEYAVPLSTEPILDEYGNDTLEVNTIYSERKELRANISANVGQEAVNAFGSLTGYSRTITYWGESCPLIEGSKVWFGSGEYTVIKVADSKNGFLIALREVSNREQDDSDGIE